MDAAAIDAFQQKVLQKPELLVLLKQVFFTPSDEVATEIKAFTKKIFDHCTKFVSKTSATPLDQLYVDGFDADQIWEQLQLQNAPLVDELTKRIRNFHKAPEQIQLFSSLKDEANQDKGEDEQDEVEKDSEADSEDEEAAESGQSDAEEEEATSSDEEALAKKASKNTQLKQKKKKKARDVAEDGFFDWDEMDKAAEEEEDSADDHELDLEDDEIMGDEDGDEDEDDDEGDDFSDEDDGSQDGGEMTYKDFFNDEDEAELAREGGSDDDEDDDVDMEDEEEFPSVKRARVDAPEEDVDEEELAERGIMSSHQRRQLLLQKEIKELEEQALGDKPWLLKGEVRSGARPENSLLEAVLDYDRPVKVAPVITEEVSIALEDMIKKRILEDEFDDVIRKFAGNEGDEKKKLEEVSMEKSKEGLGEIYEKEYMKTAMGFEADDESKQDQEEIDVMFKSLCWKLDALSNYNFTPKPIVKELQVKPSVPAIAMEEVTPIGVSDANLKAPEEIYDKKRKRGEAVLQSREEMSQAERKAQRNAKKHTRRKEKRQQEADEKLVAKLNPGLGNKYEKKKLLESLANAKNVTTGKAIEGSTKQFSNSKEFFSRLQDSESEKQKKK